MKFEPQELEQLAAALAPLVAKHLATLLAKEPGQTPSAQLLMRVPQYAARVAISRRKLDALLPPDVYVGVGRMRRIDVAKADEALRSARSAAPSERVAMALAIAHARKTKTA